MLVLHLSLIAMGSSHVYAATGKEKKAAKRAEKMKAKIGNWVPIKLGM